MFVQFAILLLIKVELSRSSCSWLTTEDCVCNYGSPGNESKKLIMNCSDQDELLFSFHVKESHISVICESDEIDSTFYNLLPALNETFLEGISNIKLSFCPLPKRFSILTEKFSSISAVSIEFACYLEACTIRGDFFDKVSNITSLTSKWNDFGTLPPNTFKNLRLLEKIEMSNNTFNYLPSKLFEFNYELKYFVLMDSKSALVLPSKFLANKSNLLSVTLANNGITTIPYKMFHNSINIEEIDLSGNYISKLSR